MGSQKMETHLHVNDLLEAIEKDYEVPPLSKKLDNGADKKI